MRPYRWDARREKGESAICVRSRRLSDVINLYGEELNLESSVYYVMSDISSNNECHNNFRQNRCRGLPEG